MIQAFAPNKTIQAAAVLLKEHGGRMSRLRLLKMLYMADRASLKAIGRSLTGDVVCALDNGPVLTRVYNLIKGEDAHVVEWSRFIRNEGKRDLILGDDPGVGKLSRFEVQTLKQIAAEFENQDDWQVAEYTHSFPEWVKNQPAKGSSKRIPLDDVLAALGLSEVKGALLEEAEAEAKADRILPGAIR